MDLKEKVRSLPLTPGVYLMKDSLGHVIYVGKAKNLKNRVQSYFHNSNSHSPKVENLVRNIADLEYQLTDTEFEAFLLECKQISLYKPIFNKKMKTPRAYAYIQLQMNAKLPVMKVSDTQSMREGDLSFGPYNSRKAVERALDGLKEAYGIHSLGICTDPIAADRYQCILLEIQDILDGRDLNIMDKMAQRMQEASARFDFETAAKIRDHISAIRYLSKAGEAVAFAEANHNIAVVEAIGASSFKLFLIKGNKVLYRCKYHKNRDKVDLIMDKLQSQILKCFRKAQSDQSRKISREELDEAQIIYRYVTGKGRRSLVIRDEWLDGDVLPDFNKLFE